MSAVGFAMDNRRRRRTRGLAVALLVMAAMMVQGLLLSADAGHQAGRLVGEMGGVLWTNRLSAVPR